MQRTEPPSAPGPHAPLATPAGGGDIQLATPAFGYSRTRAASLGILAPQVIRGRARGRAAVLTLTLTRTLTLILTLTLTLALVLTLTLTIILTLTLTITSCRPRPRARPCAAPALSAVPPISPYVSL